MSRGYFLFGPLPAYRFEPDLQSNVSAQGSTPVGIRTYTGNYGWTTDLPPGQLTVDVGTTKVFPLTDDFNRADANLEASPVATGGFGGWSWTADGRVAGALKIVSNQLTCTTTGGPSAYKVPNLGTADQFVEFKVVSVTNSTGSFFCVRLQDFDNWIGIRAGFGAANGQIEVYRRNASAMTGLYTSSADAVIVGDVVRLEVGGTNYNVYKNGVFVTDGAIGTAMTSTDAGIAARSTAVAIGDDYKTGPLIPTADAWNAYDKSVGATLSNSDRTVAFASGAGGDIRSSKKLTNGTAGKYYAELVATSSTTGATLGIKEASQALLSGTASLAIWSFGSPIQIMGTSVGWSATLSNNVPVCIAWDTGAELLWIRFGSGNWNNSSSANPATGVGGYNASAINNTPQALRAATSAAGVTAVNIRTKLVDFTQGIPPGFSSWMGEAFILNTTVNVTAPAGMTASVGQTAVIATVLQGWNSTDKTANIALSNTDRTATATDDYQGVRSTKTQLNGAPGKFYVEFQPHVYTGASFIGIHSKISDITSSNDGVYVYPGPLQGGLNVNGVPSGRAPGAMVAGDVICMAWDTGAEKIWFRINNGDWLITATDDPATGVGGLDISIMPNEAFALWFQATKNTDSASLRTQLSELTYLIPLGYQSWQGETPLGYGVNVKVNSLAINAFSGNALVRAPSFPDGWDLNSTRYSIQPDLTNGTKTATVPTDESWADISSTTGHDSGKYYVEITVENIADYFEIGVMNGDYVNYTLIYNDGWTDANVSPPSAPDFDDLVNGDIVGIAFDIDTGRVWYRVNGGPWNNDAGFSPETGIGAIDVAPNLAYLVWWYSDTYGSVTLDTTAPFYAPAPAGYDDWYDVAIPGSVTVSVTGQAVTTSVNSVTVAGKANVTVTGEFITAALNSVTVAGKANVSATGNPSTASVNSVIVAAIQNVSTLVTGLSATASVNSVTVTAVASVSAVATGQQLAPSVNNVTVAGKAVVSALGNQSSSSVGTASANTGVTTVLGGQFLTPSLNSATGYGQNIFSVTGQFVTASLNNVTVVGKAVVSATGNPVTAALNSATVVGKATAALIGEQLTPSANTVTVNFAFKVNADGQALATSVGTVSVLAGGSISAGLGGQQVSADLGTVGVLAVQNLSVGATGQFATVSTGSVTVAAGTGISVAATGLSATVTLGNPVVTAVQNLSTLVTGQSVTASVNNVLVAVGGGITVVPAGQFATASVGTVIVNAKVTAIISGTNASTASVGTVSVSGTAVVVAASAQLVAQVGTVIVRVDVPAIAAITGEVLTTSVGTVTVGIQTNAVCRPDGVQVFMPGPNPVTVRTVITAAATGQSLTASVGTVIAGMRVTVLAAGQQLGTSLGTVVARAGTGASVTGNELLAWAGYATVGGAANTTVTGNVSAVQLGAVNATGQAIALPDGFPLQTQLGTVTFKLDHHLAVPGYQMQIATGRVVIFAWGPIDDPYRDQWTLGSPGAVEPWMPVEHNDRHSWN
jgi:hypothetical protein